MKQLIISAIFVALATGLFFSVTVPILDEIGAKKEERQALLDVAGRFGDIRKAKNDLIDAYNSVSPENAARLLEVVPGTAREDDLLIIFEQVAKSSGLLVKRLDIKPATRDVAGLLIVKENPYEAVAISATLDGSYNSFVEFLKSIEKSLRIIDIKGITFHVSDLVSSSPTHEFAIEADAYMKKQAQ